MVRKLTNEESKKINSFDDYLKKCNSEVGSLKRFISDLENRRQLIIRGVELFLTHSIEEINEEDLI